MQHCMVDLEKYRANTEERKSIEQIKVRIFLEAVLGREATYDPL